MVLERALGSAVSGDATIASLHREDGVTVAEGVHVETADGAVTLTADRITYAVSGDTWDVKPSGVHATVAIDRVSGDEFSGAQSSAHVLNIRRVIAHLSNAAITFTRGAAAAPKLEIAGVDGPSMRASASLTISPPT